jgi:hypothetical protein
MTGRRVIQSRAVDRSLGLTGRTSLQRECHDVHTESERRAGIETRPLCWGTRHDTLGRMASHFPVRK